MRVVVIGAGAIGLAIADALAQRGVGVTVLDMRSPGRGAAQASAGILAPFTEAQEGSALLSLGARSLDLFDDFIARLRERSALDLEYARPGTLEVALDETDAAHLRKVGAWLDREGVASEWIDGSRVTDVDPSVTVSAAGALLITRHGFVAVPPLIAALAKSARLAGAEIESPVEAVRVDLKSDRVDVVADGRTYAADRAVIAAGSWSGRVKIAGQPALPVRPVRGQLLHLGWVDDSPRPAHIVWSARCYSVAWTNGTALVGATVEDVGFDERSTAAGVRELLAAAAELMPMSKGASIESIRVGLRPASPDGLPIVGPLPDAPHVIAATGHYRNGILLTPLTAEIVAKYICDGSRDPALTLTDPGRFHGGAGKA